MPLYILPALNYLRLRFHLVAKKDYMLPSWKGSLLRGAFGHALHRSVCTMKKEQICQNCLLRTQCAYTRLFETFIPEPAPRFLEGQISSPRPFIFEPHDKNRSYQAGDTLWFDLILIGQATDFLPYVVFSIFQMAQTGLGVRRHPFLLEAAYCYQPVDPSVILSGAPPPNHTIHEHSDSVQKNNFFELLERSISKPPNHHWYLLYDGSTQRIVSTPRPVELANTSLHTTASSSLTLKFLTPTRIIHRSELTMDFTFRMLVFKMLRRVLELTYFYMPNAEINWEFHDLLVAADDITITQRNLRWEDWERYSNRQKSKMKLGGFVGDILLEGDLSPFMELLSYSEILHVGKGTTFGLGR
ncbi:MAG: CRISPR system precrRNA processing endoribonuclease RAMP protein Cas6, partial [candidate division KSB1 bacterium]|nr:CRISPR system precrRNA processing endoribonuclease RAMP protein Cas6 [candidate division KSB1 bacterium]